MLRPIAYPVLPHVCHVRFPIVVSLCVIVDSGRYCWLCMSFWWIYLQYSIKFQLLFLYSWWRFRGGLHYRYMWYLYIYQLCAQCIRVTCSSLYTCSPFLMCLFCFNIFFVVCKRFVVGWLMLDMRTCSFHLLRNKYHQIVFISTILKP